MGQNAEQNDQLKGILLGLAAGDRNGGPIHMAVRLAESLVDRGKFDLEDIGARYLAWWHNDAFDTGPTAARVFTLVDSGLSFPVAARQVHIETGEQTAGCNPAHRSAPLAMMSHLTTQQLAEYAMEEGALTHHHPLSGDVAAAVVVICHQLVRGSTWDNAIELACAGRLPETRISMRKPDFNSLNNGGFAPDVLAAAVHFVGTSGSFEDALERSLQFAGPSNYCPVLVGSIAGARWGMSSIKHSLLEHCSILSRVHAVAENLTSR